MARRTFAAGNSDLATQGEPQGGAYGKSGDAESDGVLGDGVAPLPIDKRQSLAIARMGKRLHGLVRHIARLTGEIRRRVTGALRKLRRASAQSMGGAVRLLQSAEQALRRRPALLATSGHEAGEACAHQQRGDRRALPQPPQKPRPYGREGRRIVLRPPAQEIA